MRTALWRTYEALADPRREAAHACGLVIYAWRRIKPRTKADKQARVDSVRNIIAHVRRRRDRALPTNPPLCLSTQKPPISSVRSIDKTMDHGQESTGSPPTSLPSQGPGRRGSPPRFVSWPSWSSRRPSDRAFRSASRSASPHIHARGVVISVRRSPAPSRCSSWRAERGTSLGSRSARAPRAHGLLPVARAFVSYGLYYSEFEFEPGFAGGQEMNYGRPSLATSSAPISRSPSSSGTTSRRTARPGASA